MYFIYLLVFVFAGFILFKAFVIQQVQGNFWKSMSDSLHQKIIETTADRGTIYSDNNEMLSTSIPEFDIYIDFAAEGLRENGAKRFKENVDSLSISLSNLFNDKSKDQYKKIFLDGYKSKDRYVLLKRKISFQEFQELKKFPLIRLGKNKSGLIVETKSIRLNPYKMLAFRTIGLDRDSFKVGLELKYDSVLKGYNGRKLVRYIAGGAYIPVSDFEIDPENGKDIVTTIDVDIQEITEAALLNMMQSNEADHGCAIVMEVKTGKIKAIANLGKTKNGSYWENYNYAITPSEPGSTFKLATLLTVLEDKKVNLNTNINLEQGVWQIAGRTVYDSEKHGLNNVTVKQAFEHSSNVGMAKLAWLYYSNNPSEFIKHLQNLNLDKKSGIDLFGEGNPVIYKPGTRYWSNTTLPWMAFGYNLLITPLQTLSLYNAVANNGKMMQPYLVSQIRQDGKIILENEPKVINEKICSNETLIQLKKCLEGVVENGTGKVLYTPKYSIAGKTGTALVANGNRGYADKIYQSSFAGYFPANNPQYSIIVVIKNKPLAAKFYGAQVAGPVFKEISDKLYVLKVIKENIKLLANKKSDSLTQEYVVNTTDATKILNTIHQKTSTTRNQSSDWVKMYKQNQNEVVNTFSVKENQMPLLSGMGLKDALYVCESIGLKVHFEGKGKVIQQSISSGTQIQRGEIINIQLN